MTAMQLGEIGRNLGSVGRRFGAVCAARPIATVAAVTALASLIALTFPGLDLAVAGLFRFGGDGFPAADVAMLGTLRRAGMSVTHLVSIGLGLAVLAKILLPLLARAIPMRELLFLVTSLVLGPGLVINGLLKEWWGRPRPDETTLFGGVWDFMPAWVPGGACESNCSFPSGEASSALWLIAFAFVVPPARRRPVLWAALAWTLAISLNRMAFGRHFLSDVVIGWGLVAVIVLLCRALILERMPEAWVARLEAGLARLGDAVVRLGR